jgi:hypothetical protein
VKDLVILIWMSVLVAIVHIKNDFKYEPIFYWFTQLICILAIFLEAGGNKKRYHVIIAFLVFVLYIMLMALVF